MQGTLEKVHHFFCFVNVIWCPEGVCRYVVRRPNLQSPRYGRQGVHCSASRNRTTVPGSPMMGGGMKHFFSFSPTALCTAEDYKRVLHHQWSVWFRSCIFSFIAPIPIPATLSYCLQRAAHRTFSGVSSPNRNYLVQQWRETEDLHVVSIKEERATRQKKNRSID
jgi:hypothetical protein